MSLNTRFARPARTLAVGVLAALTLAGCASITKPNSPNNFEPSMSQGVNAVQLGVIVSVHDVRIRSGHEDLATAGGAVGGGFLGHKLGGTLGAVLGAIAGGVGGHVIESKAGKQQAQQLTIALDGPKGKAKRLISVTQATGPKFRVGELVEVIAGTNGTCSGSYSFAGEECSSGEPTRVLPFKSSPGAGQLPASTAHAQVQR